jgi:hypothetical protein
VSQFLALAIVAGCNASNAPRDAGGDASMSFTEAMRAASVAYMTNFCPAFARCDPVLFAHVFGTMATCIGADAPIDQLVDLYGYGSMTTPDAVRACGLALDLSTCDAYARFQFEAVFPDACRPMFVGTLPDDSTCRNHNQCASGRCLLPTNALPGSCGRCVAQQAVGAPCKYYFGCASGSTCHPLPATETSRCTPSGGEGDACDADRPCRVNLLCSAGTCRRMQPDDACAAATGCPFMPQLHHCDPLTSRCVAAETVALGAPCDSYHVCVHSVCMLVPGGGGDHVCSRPREAGRACSPSDVLDGLGSPCENGVCFRNTCQPHGAAECNPPPVTP